MSRPSFRLEAEARTRRGARTLFVDEVRTIPALLDGIHGLIERHRTRFILTGSGTRELKRRGAILLAGRAATRRWWRLRTRKPWICCARRPRPINET